MPTRKCTVCRAVIGSGGARGKCARCYQRTRRGGTPSLTHGPVTMGPARNLSTRYPVALLGLVDGCAELEGVDVSEWIRRAVRERVTRQAVEVSRRS